MGMEFSKRRKFENEKLFREMNEQVQQELKVLTAMEKEDGLAPQSTSLDNPLHFYCECSDLTCRQRVRLKPSKYDQIHKHRDRFVLVCGHEEHSIEKTIDTTDEFCVVEKI